jgi:uncharacterized linocin/CFP29 family protein
MSQYVAELPWTDEQWSRVCRAVTEEAQRTRVASKFLPIYGPIDSSEVAVPNIGLTTGPPRLEVNSRPDTLLATISVLVHVRTHEAADPELQAALTMFRRAANLIARTEDALMFNGQPDADLPPPLPPVGPVIVTGGDTQHGLMGSPNAVEAATNDAERFPIAPVAQGFGPMGQALIGTIVDAINALESNGQMGPYACVLSNSLYRAVHTPTATLVLPRHSILPLLEDGPLLRASTILNGWGAIVSCGSGLVEQVLASDINVKFLQVSAEPRFVFRVSERVALRVKDWTAVKNIHEQ